MIRSILFVPADRPDRFAKAVAAGADAVCVDLEDAVAPLRKGEGRRAAAAFLARTTSVPCRLFARVNPPGTHDGRDDLAALAERPTALSGIVVPKAAGPEDLAPVAAAFCDWENGISLAPLIESPSGLRQALALARAPRVVALLLGPFDLAASLGTTPSPDLLNPVRVQLRLAAAEADRAVVDGPYGRLDDEDGLVADCAVAARLGFSGKVAIHPAQVATINRAFTPPPEQIERDRRIVAAADATGNGVVAVDGCMIDRPIVLAARRRLALVERLQRISPTPPPRSS